ncbi:MAG: hypothetical protein WC129_07180 [Sphaerochaetaceae bacterium]|jgi:hypothetical protein|nr:hypothetical protein [Sphaerochaetaceae bacterium]
MTVMAGIDKRFHGMLLLHAKVSGIIRLSVLIRRIEIALERPDGTRGGGDGHIG